MATDQDQLVLSISADTTAIRNALKKLTADSKAATDKIKNDFNGIGNNDNFKGVQTNFARSARAIEADAVNLRYQLNDIATGLASGQSPFTVLSQQAGQLSQILSASGGSIKQSFAAIGYAAAGMLNPINLAIVAVGVATYAATKYFSSVDSEAAKTNKELEDHATAIGKVIDKWGEALPTYQRVLEAIKAQQDAVSQTTALVAAQDEVFKKITNTFDQSLHAALVGVESDLQALGDDNGANKLITDLANLEKKVKDQTASGADFKQVLDDLKNSTLANTPTVKALADQIGAMIPQVDKAAQQIKQLAVETAGLRTAMNGPFNLQLPNLNQLGPLTSGDVMRSTMRDVSGQVSDAAREFIKARESFVAIASPDNDGVLRVGYWSDTVTDAFGNISKVVAGTTSTIAEAERDLTYRIGKAQQIIKNNLGDELFASLDEKQQAALDSIVYNYGNLPDRIAKVIKAGGSRAQVSQAISDLGTDNGGINAKRRNMEAELYGGADFSAKTKTASMSFKELLDDANRATSVLTATGSAMESVVGSTDDFGYAVARARKEQELLNKAQEENIPLTDAMRAQISAAAEAYGRAEQAINRQKDAARDSAKETKRNAQEWAQLGQQLAGIASSAVSGLVQDLRNGVSAGEAFRNMLSKIVDDLLQLALNQALQSLFKNLFSGMTGGVGGGGGGFFAAVSHTGGTAGYGTNRRAISPMAFANAPRMHSGGIAGLHAGEVPTILQRGEMVVPALQAGRSSTGSVSLGDVNIDMAQSGYVTADTSTAKAWGENVRKIIQVEMVRQSRPGGLLVRRPV